MKKVLPIKLEFKYEEADGNEVLVQRVYNRVFDMAKQNIYSKRLVERKEVNKRDEKMSLPTSSCAKFATDR